MNTPPVVEPGQSVLRETHLRDYWKIIWQGRWTAMAIFFVVVGAAAVWSFLQTPIYRATATIEIQPQARRMAAGQDVSGLGAAGYGWFAEEKYHNTQVEIIKSRDVATRVARNLGLDSHPLFAASPDPLEAFRGMIQVLPRRETGLIEISMMGPDPDEITHWVNEVANAYVSRNLERARANVTQAIETFRTQLDDLQQEYSLAEVERFNALQESTVFTSEEQVEIVRDKLKTYNSELTEVQLELSQLRDTLERIGRMRGNESLLMELPALAESPIIKDLNTSRVELERQLESAKVDLRPGHPAYEKIVNELATVQQRIQQRIAVIVNGLQTRYDLALEHEKYLGSQIDAAERFSLEVARATSDYGVFKDRAQTKRQIFELIAKTMGEVEFGAELLNNNVSLLDEATPPLFPVQPRKRLNVAIGVMLGMFLGIAAAFFLDYLDNTFRTPDDIEKYLKLSVLGVIPKIQQQEGLANRAVKEAYQSLRTSIIFSSKNRQRKIILISSTGPQEGKSSTVANLARMLAAAGDRVLVIDADLRRPTQHLLHKLERDHGITNFLTAPLDETDWTPYVKPSGDGPATLHILTCGPIPPSPPELLGSERFSTLLSDLRQAYDWVLIDSPPAASLADSTLLASMADMLVVVVQHNRTDRDLVSKTLMRLRSVNDTVAGAVLNNVDLERAYDKDYYYAGYYYYTEEGQKRGRKRGAEPKAHVG